MMSSSCIENKNKMGQRLQPDLQNLSDPSKATMNKIIIFIFIFFDKPFVKWNIQMKKQFIYFDLTVK